MVRKIARRFGVVPVQPTKKLNYAVPPPDGPKLADLVCVSQLLSDALTERSLA